MKLFFIAAFAFVAMGMAGCKNQSSSQSNTDSLAVSGDSSRAPVLSFETTSYDFGKIKEGEKVSYDFKFANNGKSPLIISNASASCGCTVPEKPDAPIGPGESGVIKVVFNSSGKQGMQNKTVTITSNAQPSTSELVLIGEVESLTK